MIHQTSSDSTIAWFQLKKLGACISQTKYMLDLLSKVNKSLTKPMTASLKLSINGDESFDDPLLIIK
ncbi:hypothetical protein CR513_52632, partial [Mucuna pruriens]